MALTKPEPARRGRHPWLVIFEANPRVETARLLSGFAAVDPYRRADAPDAAELVFGPLPADDPLRQALGDSLVAWLNERRRVSLERRGAYGLDPFVREVSDAFRIVSRLELVDAARHLRGEFHEWDLWTRPLMLTPARDARRVYLRLCALMQTALGDGRLEPVWLDLCRDAGRDLFDAYLSVGLLGLRRMPAAEPGFEPARRVALGLAVWARAKHPTHDDFMREWRAIKCLYPRAKPAWHEIVAAAIKSAEKAGDGPFQAATWWRKDVSMKEQQPHLRRGRGAPPIRPVTEAAERLRREPLTEDLISTVKRLMDERERHAVATGESEFIVKTACNFATRLLAHRASGFALALDFVRRALNWTRDDGYVWALWSQVLEAQGDRRSAELVGWEAVRRFPEQVDKRCLLAEVLAVDPRRSKEAEALLRETIERFPGHAYALNQLAKLLAADATRKKEAEVLLRETIKRSQSNQSTRNQLANLLAADPTRWGEAEALLRETIEFFPSAVEARHTLAGLLLQQGRVEEAGKELDDVARFGTQAHYFALRQRWAYRTGGADAARRWLEEGLNRFPGNPRLLQKLEKLSETGTVDDEDDDWLALLLGEDDGREREASWDAGSGALRKATDAAMEADETPPTASDWRLTAVDDEAPGLVPMTVGADAATWTPRDEDFEHRPLATADLTYVDALRHGRTRRADFALNGAGLDETGRADARADLEAMLKHDESFVYGRLVALRRLDDDPGETVWRGLGRHDAIAIARAWRAGELQKLAKLAEHSTEQLLARCAAALAGNKNARASFAEAIVGGSKADGRGSRALRKSLDAHLKAYAERNADGLPKLGPESAERLLEDQPDLVTHALTEAIDASFDYQVTQASG